MLWYENGNARFWNLDCIVNCSICEWVVLNLIRWYTMQRMYLETIQPIYECRNPLYIFELCLIISI